MGRGICYQGGSICGTPTKSLHNSTTFHTPTVCIQERRALSLHRHAGSLGKGDAHAHALGTHARTRRAAGGQPTAGGDPGRPGAGGASGPARGEGGSPAARQAAQATGSARKRRKAAIRAQAPGAAARRGGGGGAPRRRATRRLSPPVRYPRFRPPVREGGFPQTFISYHERRGG